MLSPVRVFNQSTLHLQNPALHQDYERLSSHFLALAKRLEDEPVSEKNPVPSWKPQLQALSRDSKSNRLLSEYVVAAHPKKAEQFRDAYAKSTLLLEAEGLKKAVKSDYQALNQSFADKEAQISGMKPTSTALFVGSGPQPNTVLSYAKYASTVKGIDIEQHAIDSTQNIAKKSGGKLSFEQANGHTFNYKGFSHIGIAVMVPGKDKILQRILETADAGAIIILRSVDGFKKAMYEGCDSNSLRGFEKVATLHGSDHNITHALILRKQALSLLG